MENALWHEPLYRETVGLILLFLILIGSILFFFRKENPKLTAAWVSTKSWIFVAPVILFLVGLPEPAPLILLTLMSIYSAKTFFRMVGMYHRSWFVMLTYFFIGLSAWLCYRQEIGWFNLMPILFLFFSCCIPILRNSFSKMIQYIALSLICYIFFCWSFMHTALILNFEKGVYVVLYLYLLTEFSFNSSLFFSRFFGKTKLLSKITSRFTLEGFLFSIFITTLLAWAMRHLLPVRTEEFWLTAAISFSVLGKFGDLILSVLRRDLGMKDSGVFIIGRDDILARVDKFIIAAPVFYYVYLYLILRA